MRRGEYLDKDEVLNLISSKLNDETVTPENILDEIEAGDIVDYFTRYICEPDNEEQHAIMQWVLANIPYGVINIYTDGL